MGSEDARDMIPWKITFPGNVQSDDVVRGRVAQAKTTMTVHNSTVGLR